MASRTLRVRRNGLVCHLMPSCLVKLLSRKPFLEPFPDPLALVISAKGNKRLSFLAFGSRRYGPRTSPLITKPSPTDAGHQKEKYILAKLVSGYPKQSRNSEFALVTLIQYVEKQLVSREATASGDSYYAISIWEAVKTNNLREVYRLIATSDVNIVNTTYDALGGVNLHHDSQEHDLQGGFCDFDEKLYDPAACQKIKDSSKSDNCLQGCSLLHLACQAGYPLMLELLLQFGADINKCDYHGRTPLHHCISAENNQLAKILLRRFVSLFLGLVKLRIPPVVASAVHLPLPRKVT
ncbi:hypothetical protein RJ639_015819 [Escallonia herrerae]|uniref:Uncharacterized protein n=1 Tax=Escallonia herrerae TaxID=1293975 RepID=A0AA89AKH9_9ASTE|nr:hypothetical protein RJ639_015819 [Escallonia herrerae]